MAAGGYGSRRQTAGGGGVVSDVLAGGPLARAGVVPGDAVLKVDGAVVADVLDWQWASDGTDIELEMLGDDGRARHVRAERGLDEPWGVGFDGPLFDGVRTCRNDCGFCFMKQLPEGLRDSLYVRDDDFRLSFLQGNFITLTNLSDGDVVRIVEQRLSPLYVSLHAVDPDVRKTLVSCSQDRALERFDELVEGGIDLHVQVVLVPSVNDGEVLERTLAWLAEREGVVSVGVVPLGYTRYQSGLASGYESPLRAAEVIAQVQTWQFAMREREGRTWVHLADEFYLNAKAPFPLTEFYDGFPQYENGIGMVRCFADEAAALRGELSAAVSALPEGDTVSVVTSVMAATTVAGALQACEAAGKVRLLVVPNRFFGGNVSVTGLLTGQDVAAAIAADDSEGTYLVPDVIFNADEVTLDEYTPLMLSEESGAELCLVSSDAAGLLEGLESIAVGRRAARRE